MNAATRGQHLVIININITLVSASDIEWQQLSGGSGSLSEAVSDSAAVCRRTVQSLLTLVTEQIYPNYD